MEREKRDLVIVGLLGLLLVGAINIPARALIADPNIGTPNQLKPTPDPTPEQIEKQMNGPSVTPPVRAAEPEARPAPTELPSGPDPQAVAAALGGAKPKPTDRDRPTRGERSSALLGLAIAAGILGLICAAGVLVVRLGPKPPEPIDFENTSR